MRDNLGLEKKLRIIEFKLKKFDFLIYKEERMGAVEKGPWFLHLCFRHPADDPIQCDTE